MPPIIDWWFLTIRKYSLSAIGLKQDLKHKVNLKWRPKDNSGHCLDFPLIYKTDYIVNFEYFTDLGNILFEVVGVFKNDKRKYFKTVEEMKGYNSTLLEIKKKIESIIK